MTVVFWQKFSANDSGSVRSPTINLKPPSPLTTCAWATTWMSSNVNLKVNGTVLTTSYVTRKRVSDSRTMSTGSPPSCVLYPLLFSLYTNSCTSSHQFVKLQKFQMTPPIRFICGGDESTYWWETQQTQTFWDTPLWKETVAHQDQNLTPQQFLPVCSCPHQ